MGEAAFSPWRAARTASSMAMVTPSIGDRAAPVDQRTQAGQAEGAPRRAGRPCERGVRGAGTGRRQGRPHVMVGEAERPPARARDGQISQGARDLPRRLAHRDAVVDARAAPNGSSSAPVSPRAPDFPDVDPSVIATSERRHLHHHMGHDRPEMLLEHVLHAVAPRRGMQEGEPERRCPAAQCLEKGEVVQCGARLGPASSRREAECAQCGPARHRSPDQEIEHPAQDHSSAGQRNGHTVDASAATTPRRTGE